MPQQLLLQCGPYRFDPARGQLWRQGQVIALPPRALAVLSQLVAQAGQLVTKEALLAAGWPDTAVTEWVLTTCMRELRRALGDDARQPRYIETVHRRGYRFMAKVTALTETALEAPDGRTVSPGPPEAAPSAVSSESLGADAQPGPVAPQHSNQRVPSRKPRARCPQVLPSRLCLWRGQNTGISPCSVVPL
jgi:DNA-binding winged helix-turn-helix (wHTH) protein